MASTSTTRRSQKRRWVRRNHGQTRGRVITLQLAAANVNSPISCVLSATANERAGSSQKYCAASMHETVATIPGQNPPTHPLKITAANRVCHVSDRRL
jgi:hypothetical protein